MVGTTGFEPATSWSQTKCSTGLSYVPNTATLPASLPSGKRIFEQIGGGLAGRMPTVPEAGETPAVPGGGACISTGYAKSDAMTRQPLLLAALASLLFCGCSSTKYAVLEKLGIPKREVFKKYVAAARDEQKEAGEQFQDALTRLKSVYNFTGGKMEEAYDGLKSEYDRSNTKALAVKKRIRDVESISGALFTEWENEIQQITTPALAADSRGKLTETRSRYESMHSALVRAEQSMDPVLAKLRDHVLYLKHNLNTQAIASLKGEATNIQTDIGRLIEEMNTSIRKADEFIRTLQ